MNGFVLRLVFLSLILIIIYRMVQRAIHNSTAHGNTANSPTENHSQTHGNEPSRAQLMRPCAQCHVHIPEGESSQSRGYFFCCEAHRNEFFMSAKK